MLEIFRKKNCSFCKKSIYAIPEKMILDEFKIEIYFCEKCNLMSIEEKAVVTLAKLIKQYPEMDINKILKEIKTKDE